MKDDETDANASSNSKPPENVPSDATCDLPEDATREGSTEYSRQLSEQRPDQLPSSIGPYRIVRKIAEGGMGAVCLAEQSEPIQRRVAIKLIRVDFQSSHQIIARFEAERQALAMMEHPNIAKILDGGTTDEGLPYFVMELVDGVPITEYCDSVRLSIRDRLSLFHSVCKAVQHAHTKGIVHRDLKPSNVLVTLIDGNPVAKVIDFGLAKAVRADSQLTAQSVHTELGQILGTLQYMSPEQANVDNDDIDTRTDIYSLGVILYELLTGSTPLDRDTLRENAILRVLELIREKEPLRPSSQLSSDRNTTQAASQRRQIASSRLRGLLRGELDWVVMKALEKQRSRRYETADRFADDVERYLDNRAVMARPASAGYRLQKLIRRHRAAVVASVLIVFTLIGASVVSILFGVDAIRQRIAAQTATTKETAARKRADEKTIEAQKATARALREKEGQSKLTRQLSQLLDAGDPLLGRLLSKYGSPFGEATSLVDVARLMTLDELADRTNLLDFPDVRAELLNTLGDIAISSGDVHHARNVFSKSEQLLASVDTPDPQQVAKSQMAIATCDYLLGDLATAKIALLSYLDHPVLGADIVDANEIKRDRAFGAFVLSAIYIEEEDFDAAQGLLGEVAQTPAGDSKDLPVLSAFAQILSGILAVYKTEIYDEPLLNASPEIAKATAAVVSRFWAEETLFSPFKSVIQSELTSLVLGTDSYPDYETMHSELVETVGEDHFLTLISQYGLAHAARRFRDTETASKHFQKIIELTTKTVGRKHPRFAMMLSLFGDMKFDQWKESGRSNDQELAEVQAMLSEALEIRERSLGEHRLTGKSHYQLGRLHYETKNYAKALEHFSASLVPYEAFYGDHFLVSRGLLWKSEMAALTGQFELSLPDARAMVELDRRLLQQGDQPRDRVGSHQFVLARQLLDAPESLRSPTEAKPLLIEAIANMKTSAAEYRGSIDAAQSRLNALTAVP